MVLPSSARHRQRDRVPNPHQTGNRDAVAEIAVGNIVPVQFDHADRRAIIAQRHRQRHLVHSVGHNQRVGLHGDVDVVIARAVIERQRAQRRVVGGRLDPARPRRGHRRARSGRGRYFPTVCHGRSCYPHQ